MNALNQLLDKHAGPPIALEENIHMAKIPHNTLGAELLALLKTRNGFYAFGSALHVFPLSHSLKIDLLEWNKIELWKKYYPTDLRNVFCFAENTFGEQFCIEGEKIMKLDPETSKLFYMAHSLTEWAQVLLENPDYFLGCSLSLNWEENYRHIRIGHRLVPRTPFVCGGEFDINNLIELDALRGMRIRGELAHNIKNIPDGETVKFVINMGERPKGSVEKQ